MDNFSLKWKCYIWNLIIFSVGGILILRHVTLTIIETDLTLKLTCKTVNTTDKNN
jgi:hypothetical protein